MKKLNLNLIIEIVLAIAIIVLFVLHFRSHKNTQVNGAVTDISTQKAAPGTIAYVSIDTIMKHYAMSDDLRSKLTGKQQLYEAEMSNKSKNYQAGVQDYQNKAQKGLITRADAAKMEQQLAGEQQQLMKLRDDYSGQLAEEEQVMNRQIISSLMEYLSEYNKDKGYNFIFGNTFGSVLLYANKSLDITPDVLKGLNEKYKSEKEKNPKKVK